MLRRRISCSHAWDTRVRYAEGVETGTHHVYWRLVTTAGIVLAADTVQVTVINGDLTAHRPLHQSGAYAPFAKTAVEKTDEESMTLGPGIRINGDDDNGYPFTGQQRTNL